MIKQEEFLTKYNVSKQQYVATGLVWSELEEIFADYEAYVSELLITGNLISDRLRQIKEVHSLKIRVKDSEHLIEKIIRKRIEEPDRQINLQSYKTEITDLIGVRALHLFKDDWVNIHNSIREIWELHEKPKAYIRSGDSEQSFEDQDCQISQHKAGYRSVHYLIRSQPTKNMFIAEIQVRTIFEEGWSEIDHKLRYPYDTENALLAEYLAIFNRLAGNADEMGSYIKLLKVELEARDQKHKQDIEAFNKEKKKMIGALESLKKELQVETAAKKKLQDTIDSISKLTPPINNTSTWATAGSSFLDTIKNNSTAQSTWLTAGSSFLDTVKNNSSAQSTLIPFSQTAASIMVKKCPFCEKGYSASLTGIIEVCPHCGRIQNY